MMCNGDVFSLELSLCLKSVVLISIDDILVLLTFPGGSPLPRIHPVYTRQNSLCYKLLSRGTTAAHSLLQNLEVDA